MATAIDKAKDALGIALDLATKAVIAAAITALPLLGFPVIKQAFSWVVTWVVGKLKPLLLTWLGDTLIDIQVAAELRGYEHARDELKIILAKQVSDPTEVQNASDEFDKRLADLIRIRH